MDDSAHARKAKMMVSCDFAVDMASPRNQSSLEDYRLRSEAVRHGPSAIRDIEYGSRPAEVLDLYVPAGAGAAPLVVFIHGGWWKASFRHERAFLAPTFVDAGIAFAAVGYPLAPEHALGDIVASVSRALSWLNTHASTYGCDGSRLMLVGNSAGGHLAAMAGSQDVLTVSGAPPMALRGVCAISGLYDLAELGGTFVDEWLNLDEATIRDFSPVLHLPPPSVPVCLGVGTNEPQGFHRQQELYASQLSNSGRTLENHRLEGHTHFTIISEIARQGSPLHDFITEHL